MTTVTMDEKYESLLCYRYDLVFLFLPISFFSIHIFQRMCVQGKRNSGCYSTCFFFCDSLMAAKKKWQPKSQKGRKNKKWNVEKNESRLNKKERTRFFHHQNLSQQRNEEGRGNPFFHFYVCWRKPFRRVKNLRVTLFFSFFSFRYFFLGLFSAFICCHPPFKSIPAFSIFFSLPSTR